MNTYQQMVFELLTIWQYVENEQQAVALHKAKRFRFKWKMKRKKLPRLVLKELQRLEMYARVELWLGSK